MPCCLYVPAATRTELSFTALLFSKCTCSAFVWQGFGYRDGFSEKLPGALPVSNRARASWLQDQPTAAQGQASVMMATPLG